MESFGSSPPWKKTKPDTSSSSASDTMLKSKKSESPGELMKILDESSMDFQGTAQLMADTWERFSRKRWPSHFPQKEWICIYFEGHLQECIDICASIAALTKCDISEVKVPDEINWKAGFDAIEYQKLFFHCRMFGKHASKLRLPVELLKDKACMEEFIAENVKLEEISFKDFQWEKVDQDCVRRLLSCDALKTLRITGGVLTDESFEALHHSICKGGSHDLNTFIVESSSITRRKLAPGLLKVIENGRSLRSLTLSAMSLGKEEISSIFCSLRRSQVEMLDISCNQVTGFFKVYQDSYKKKSTSTTKELWKLPLKEINMRECSLSRNDFDELVLDDNKLLPCLQKLHFSKMPYQQNCRNNFDSSISVTLE